MNNLASIPEPNSRRQALWRVIFLSDTRAGRAFDVVLLCLIGLSVLTVMLESVAELRVAFGKTFVAIEWTFTVIFTIEYLLRLWVVRHSVRYAASFFGIVDLLSILPSWLALVIPDAQYFMALRVLRMLRIFRIMHLAEHVEEAGALIRAIKASRRKIIVFLVSVISLVCVEGTIMYVIENHAKSGFTSIPQSIYWAIVVITTVGTGETSPVTLLGKIMSSIIMLTGFAIIAVPTGIVSSEMSRGNPSIDLDQRICAKCGHKGHLKQASHCHQCGQQLF